jgi:hypothetical protein
VTSPLLVEKGDPKPWRLVVVESPFAGARWDVPLDAKEARNLRYLRACLADCIRRGESPYASHGLLTQPGVLDDTSTEERRKGILAGFAWGRMASAWVVYTDLGVSDGMRDGLIEAHRFGKPVETRSLGADWEAKPKRESTRRQPKSFNPWQPGTP